MANTEPFQATCGKCGHQWEELSIPDAGSCPKCRSGGDCASAVISFLHAVRRRESAERRSVLRKLIEYAESLDW